MKERKVQISRELHVIPFAVLLFFTGISSTANANLLKKCWAILGALNESFVEFPRDADVVTRETEARSGGQNSELSLDAVETRIAALQKRLESVDALLEREKALSFRRLSARRTNEPIRRLRKTHEELSALISVLRQQAVQLRFPETEPSPAKREFFVQRFEQKTTPRYELTGTEQRLVDDLTPKKDHAGHNDQIVERIATTLRARGHQVEVVEVDTYGRLDREMQKSKAILVADPSRGAGFGIPAYQQEATRSGVPRVILHMLPSSDRDHTRFSLHKRTREIKGHPVDILPSLIAGEIHGKMAHEFEHAFTIAEREAGRPGPYDVVFSARSSDPLELHRDLWGYETKLSADEIPAIWRLLVEDSIPLENFGRHEKETLNETLEELQGRAYQLEQFSSDISRLAENFLKLVPTELTSKDMSLSDRLAAQLRTVGGLDKFWNLVVAFKSYEGVTLANNRFHEVELPGIIGKEGYERNLMARAKVNHLIQRKLDAMKKAGGPLSLENVVKELMQISEFEQAYARYIEFAQTDATVAQQRLDALRQTSSTVAGQSLELARQISEARRLYEKYSDLEQPTLGQFTHMDQALREIRERIQAIEVGRKP